MIVLWISTPPSYGLYFGHSLSIVNDKQPSPLLANQIAVTQKGSVYVVWADKQSIYFNSSQGNENKVASTALLSDDNKLASSPQIAATENGNVYIAWIDKNSTTGVSNLVFRSSNDSGENFSDRKELGGIDVLPFSPQIAATENGNVYIVWVDIDNTTGDSNIVFRSSNDSGENFAERKQIRGGKDLSLSPQIAATENGNVYIVWVDFDGTTGDSNILFRSSNDSGENFAQRKHLRTGKVLSFSPQIAATEKGNVYLVWLDKDSTTGDSNIIFISSINNGENFESRVHLNKDPSKLSKSFSPQIAATENGNVYMVWIEDHVQFKEILDKGNLFGETISLNKISNMTSSSSPQIAATENGNVYVVWVNKNNTSINETLLYKRISQFFFDRNS